jgi:hypothetical protein
LLDEACGQSDRWFRMKVRQLVERRRALLVRPRPSAYPDVGRD